MRNSNPVSFGGFCALVSMLVAAGALSSIMHVSFFLALVLVAVVVFVILPLAEYIP